MRPCSSTTICSASRIVESRCAIAIVVRSCGEAVERVLHEALGLVVERARGLVEDEDRRVPEDRPGDRDALLLAAREAIAALADDGVVALGQRGDHVVDPRRLRGRLELVVRSVGLGEAQVLAHRRMEEIRLLRDDAHEVRQGLEAEVAHVDAADRDAPSVDVVEARREVAERRLAGAGLPHDRRRRPCRDGERGVPQRPLLVVAEPDVVEDDVARAGRR